MIIVSLNLLRNCLVPAASATISTGGKLMGTVMIRCPTTGREISTGIQAEREKFGRSPVFFARSYCPLCQTDHEWFAAQAWIVDRDSMEAA
jgi:hypothetical protein